MEEQEDELGSLFKTSFEGHKAPLEEGEWDALSNSLEKRNFFRFNPYQFNIYYASTIIACFFICLGVGSHYVYKRYPFAEPKAETSITVTDTFATRTILEPKIRSTEDLPEEFSSKSNPLNVSFEKKKAAKEVTKEGPFSKQPQIQSISFSVKKDTVTSIAPHITILHPTADSSKLNKKVLYITKQDTIFKYDTVRTRKPRKRWLK